MERGEIQTTNIPGGIDLQATLESGQTYHWSRLDGTTYSNPGGRRGNYWYQTILDGEIIRVRQKADLLEWESTTEAEDLIHRLVRLDDNLPQIADQFPSDDVVEDAWQHYRGMRLVKDPPFRCLISFICSTQMRVERIFQMQRRLTTELGEEVNWNGEVFHEFPSPTRLARTSETRLRELGLGYRAPYVTESAQMIVDGTVSFDAIGNQEYETARTMLTDLVGVGPKVADCVLLFSFGFLEAVPLDTWINSAIEEYFPDCEGPSYQQTSRAIRARLGGSIAGYTQTYLFHYLRTH